MGGLYPPAAPSVILSKAVLLHMRLGHVGISTLRQTLASAGIEGVRASAKVLAELTNSQCQTCIAAKLTRKDKSKSKPIELLATRINQRWYVDLIGPIRVSAANTKKNIIHTIKYIMVVVDEFSRYTFVRLLSKKSDSTQEFINLIKNAQTQTGVKLEQINMDNGELKNNTINQFASDNGIEIIYTNPDSPHQNSIVERKNGHIISVAKSLLIGAQLPPCFWQLAVVHAVYVINRLVLKSTNNVTPLQLYYKQKPQFKHMRAFGSDSYIYVPKRERDSKLFPSAMPA